MLPFASVEVNVMVFLTPGMRPNTVNSCSVWYCSSCATVWAKSGYPSAWTV